MKSTVDMLRQQQEQLSFTYIVKRPLMIASYYRTHAFKMLASNREKHPVTDPVPETFIGREIHKRYGGCRCIYFTYQSGSAPAERLPALLHIVHQQLLLWHTRLHFLHQPIVIRDEVLPVTVLPVQCSWMTPHRRPEKLVEPEKKRGNKTCDAYCCDNPIATDGVLNRVCPHLQYNAYTLCSKKNNATTAFG
jgi:hypothetical protein